MPATQHSHHAGRGASSPPLGLLATVFVGLFVASVAANFVMTDFAPYPIPYNAIEQLQDYYTRFPDAMRIVSFCKCGPRFRSGSFRS